MASLATIRSRLKLLSQEHLPDLDLDSLVNRILQEETEGYPWHRRIKYAVVNSVVPKEGGTVSITQGAVIVTGSGTSFAAADVGKVLRIGNTNALVFISAFVSTTELTLATTWPDVTQTAAGYSLFPFYYSAPSDAEEVVNVLQRVDLEKVATTEIHRRDPSRRLTGTFARAWAPAGRDSSDLPRFQLWPIPASALPYMVEYLIGHSALVSDTDKPVVPGSLVENKAMVDICLAIHALNGDQRWLRQSEWFQKRYEDEWTKAIERDKANFGSIRNIQDAYSGLTDGYDFVVEHDGY